MVTQPYVPSAESRYVFVYQSQISQPKSIRVGVERAEKKQNLLEAEQILTVSQGSGL